MGAAAAAAAAVKRLLLFPRSPLLFLLLVSASLTVPAATVDDFPRDGTVIELDESNFDAAIAAFDVILVDFYAPWCGHCQRLNPELDAAAPVLAGLSKPIFIAKINADKYRNLASKHEVDGFPTMKIFMHGIPVEYTGPRKAELLVRSLKKFAAPDVSILESDSLVHNFVEAAGTDFPIFIGFGLNESVIVELARKYKIKAWFAVAKDFSEDMMVAYDFDKISALVSLHPKYNEQSVFYGPFEGDFLGDFIRQNLLPPTVPINLETLKMLKDDERKIVLAIIEDELDGNSQRLIKVLRSAATANRDLVFGYLGVKQWEDFADTFDATRSSKLPKIMVWDGNDEYHVVEGYETLEDDDQGSQISRFLEAYREGRTIRKKIKGPSLMGFINSLISMNTVYLITFIVVILMVIQLLSSQGADVHQARQTQQESGIVESESQRDYQPGSKED